MTWLSVKDNAISTLALPLASGALSATLTTGTGSLFPTSNFIVTICQDNGTNLEKILVDSRSGDVLTINASGRGYGGTSDVYHASGEKVFIGTIQHPIEELQNAFNPTTGHDHDGTDSKQVDHGGLGGLADDDHPQYVKHSLATAINDFLVASGASTFVKKTLAEVLTILGKGAASGLASLDANIKVEQDPANATATPTASKIPIADGSGKLDGWVSPASETVQGKVELATASEINTGTDNTRAMSPDAFAGSTFGRRVAMIVILDKDTALTTGDGKYYFPIPAEFNGMNLVAAHACVDTASTSGTPTIQLYHSRYAADILSTLITIDVNEETSYTATTPPVINTSYDDVQTGDKIRVDVDVAGTGTKGLTLIFSLSLP